MNRETCRSVLCGLLNGFGSPDDFGPTDWVNPVHRAIHGAIKSIVARGDTPDFVMVARELPEEYRPDGRVELAALLEYPVVSERNYEAHRAAFVRDRKVLDLRDGARVLLGELEKGEASPEVNRALRKLEEISSRGEAKGITHFSEGLEDLFTVGDKPAVPWGLECMEDLRIEAGDMCVIAARPGAGKTAMLGTVAVNAAIRNWHVLFLSLEMPSIQIRQRMLAGYSGIPLPNIIRVNDERMVRAATEMRQLPMWVEDGNGSGKARLDVETIVQMVKMFKTMAGDKHAVVLIDYLQIVPTRYRAERRYELLGHVCRELKRCALQNEVPVIVAAQLSRAVEQRGKEARPQLSDLRESGEIEQVADQVVLMHRQPDRTVLGVAKYRNGPTFIADARFVGETCRFEDFGLL